MSNAYSMARRKRPKTMTELLRAALAKVESLSALERATGLKRQSMAKFLAGKQSLRLDCADRLAAHFGIECRHSRNR